MKIISIKKRRIDAEIIFDDNSKLYVDYKIIFDNGLRKNDDIPETLKKDLVIQNEKLKIKNSAFRLLSRRSHSRFELIQKLHKKKFDINLIDAIVAELIEQDFLDDLKFAKLYAEEKFDKKIIGKNKIKAGLISKGVNQKIIEKVISEMDLSSAEENAFELAQKKIKFISGSKSGNKNIKQKISTYLYSKGFESDIIYNVLKKMDFLDDYSDL